MSQKTAIVGGVPQGFVCHTSYTYIISTESDLIAGTKFLQTKLDPKKLLWFLEQMGILFDKKLPRWAQNPILHKRRNEPKI